jgi:hypothetical protein
VRRPVRQHGLPHCRIDGRGGVAVHVDRQLHCGLRHESGSAPI